jgi:hypothetical protein
MNDITNLYVQYEDKINNIKPEIYYCYVMVSRLLSKNPNKEDGLPSIDHEILIDLEDVFQYKNYQQIYNYIIMLEYSKRNYPILIKKINSIIKKYKKFLKNS